MASRRAEQTRPPRRPSSNSGGGGGSKLLLVGCLVVFLLLLCCGGLGGGGLYGVMRWMKGQTPYVEAMTALSTNSDCERLLGRPMEDGFLALGTIQRDDAGGTASMQVPVSGPMGSGLLRFEATAEGDTWAFSTLQLTMDGSGEQIDLLADVQAAHSNAVAGEVDDIMREAEALAGQGRFDQAVKRCDDALARDPALLRGWLLRGRANLSAGEVAAAEADLNRVLALSPDHPEAALHLGLIYEMTARPAECVDAFTKVLRADSSEALPWYHRALCFERLEEPRQALAGAREACSRGLSDACTMAKRLE
jgi:hypothetical protein